MAAVLVKLLTMFVLCSTLQLALFWPGASPAHACPLFACPINCTKGFAIDPVTKCPNRCECADPCDPGIIHCQLGEFCEVNTTCSGMDPDRTCTRKGECQPGCCPKRRTTTIPPGECETVCIFFCIQGFRCCEIDHCTTCERLVRCQE